MRAALAVCLCALSIATFSRPAQADALGECIATHEKAQTDWRAARLISAREGVIKCIDVCPSEIALDCSTLLPQIEASTPTAVAAATDENGADMNNARVTIDDRIVLDRLQGMAVPLDPGEHRFRIEWPNGERAEQTVVLNEGEKNRRVVFARPRAPSPAQTGAPSGPRTAPVTTSGDGRKTAAYVLAAASAGFLATFAIAAIAGKQKENELDRCKPYCSQAQADAMHSRYLIADISLGLTLATGGVASYLFFSSGSSAPAANGASLRAPDRFVIGIQHAF